MATLLFVLIILAGIHFAYDGIISPIIRLNLRYNLFALRDKLRMLKIEQGDKISDELFEIMNRAINSRANYLSIVNIGNIARAIKKMADEPSFKKEVDRQLVLIESCEVEGLKEIDKEFTKIGAIAFFVNGATWGIYLIPVFIIIGLITYIINMGSTVIKSAKHNVRLLTYVVDGLTSKKYPELQLISQEAHHVLIDC